MLIRLIATALLLVAVSCSEASPVATERAAPVESAATPILAEMSDADLTAKFGWKTMTMVGAQAIGTRPLLVIYREIPGSPMAHDSTYYDNLIFGHGSRSVVDYFSQVSNGQFTWSRAGVIVDRGLDEYGASTQRMEGTAIKHASDLGFNFAQYDRDGDGYIQSNELVVLVIMSAAPDGPYSAHNWATSPTSIAVAGGKTVLLNAVALGHQASFASYTHELLHSLGTIDLYYTLDGDNHANEYITVMAGTIVRAPDVMDTIDLDPYHKMRLGWVRPKVRTVTDVDTVTLAAGAVASTPAISNESPILAYDPARGTRQYFLLEHRAPLGYDAQVVGRGVALWQVIADASFNPEVMTSGVSQRGVYAINTLGMASASVISNSGMFLPFWYTGTWFNNRFRATNFSSNLQTVDLSFSPTLTCPVQTCPKNTTWNASSCLCVPNLPPGPTGAGGSAIAGEASFAPQPMEIVGTGRNLAPMNCFGNGRSQP